MSRWLEIRLPVPETAADLVGQLLTDFGSVGLIAGDQPLDTFTVPDPDSFRNDPVLRAFFPWPDSLETFRTALFDHLAAFAPLLPDLKPDDIECVAVADADWANSWKQHFTPFLVGDRLVIRPSWVEWLATPGQVVLTLDPGQAFGTGSHATTSLCLEKIADLFASGPAPRSVLDVGTGSGILAMAAAALGATRVVGNDIDSEACRVALENIRQNGLHKCIRITPQPLEQIEGRFDLVLANILAGENIRLAPLFIEHLQPGGVLLLSGILVEQEAQVVAAYAAQPVELLEIRQRDEWLCLVYRRHG
ncbi:MAG: 50S ribosomal protein L11 methyltransferase [Desulfuromonadales bacterium]|nr:50S ribosomal protein L11 methyltransferase [Desulfuromonadales bacterium]